VTEYTLEDWKALCIDLRREVEEWRLRALNYELQYFEERALRMRLEIERRERERLTND